MRQLQDLTRLDELTFFYSTVLLAESAERDPILSGDLRHSFILLNDMSRHRLDRRKSFFLSLFIAAV